MRLCVLIALLLAGCASTGPQLTPLEEQKLDHRLQQLLLGESVNDADYDVTPGPPGEKRYGVLVRTDNPDEIRKAGLDVTSVFGEIAVVHVTVGQLRALAALPAVRKVMSGSKSLPQ